MSKLSFRARALDPSKPMPIYLAEDLPDLPEYSAINRAVPQMPSGMEKEEESEHHLQRAICTGLIIPTPEVYDSTDSEFYDKYYPADYKLPKQLIHMQPLNLEQDIPDYDMDSSDEVWVTSHGKKLDIDPLKFEIMMDRLEKSSGQTVVTLNEAKALLKQDDEVSIAVYDYWLNKRLKTQHPLILYVKTENRGNMTPNNPYLAFRRRTEKMQTRKNRKNDESSYEKMLKLRRELSRAVTLLEMIKRREKLKREQLHLSIEIYEKRYQAQDFHGQLLSELTTSATRASRPAFAPIYSNQFPSLAGGQGVNVVGGTATGSGGVYLPSGGGTSSQYSAGAGSSHKRDNESLSSRKEKRQYKKRKLKIQKDRSLGGSGASGGTGGRDALGGGGALGGSSGSGSSGNHHHHHHHHHHHGAQHHPHHHHPHLHHHHQHHPSVGGAGTVGGSRDGCVPGGHDHLLAGGDQVGSSDDEELANLAGGTSPEEEYAYAFRRSKHSQYHRPRADGYGNWPWTSREENGSSDPRFRFTLTSLRYPRPRCIGFARRRLGRGGRVIIDRVATDLDELWSRLDYTIVESETIASLTARQHPDSGVAADDESEVVGDLRPTVNQSRRTASVSSNCSAAGDVGTPTSVVVSLKPPRQLSFGQPLVNGGDALEPLDPSVDDRTIDGGGVQRVRRRLVLKQEYPEVAVPPQVTSDGYDESDGGDGSEQQFLASIGLMNKMKEAARQVLSDMHEDDERALLAVKARDEVRQRRRRVCPTDGRTFPPAMADGDGESDNGSGGVQNSDSIVIKSEEDATTAALAVAATERTRTASLEEEPSCCVVKLELDQSVMSPKSAGGEPEDFEQLIDSVISKGPRTVLVRRSNSISSSTDPTPPAGSSEVLVAVSEESGADGGGSSPSRLHDATREDIDAVYKDLLNDIQSNWLHFRPKTPSPCPDDVLTLEEEEYDEVRRQGGELDDQLEACIGLTDRNRITLELQALEEGLPESIFANRSGSLFRTVPYALDSLLEPHPLSVASDEAEAADATGTGLRTEVKLETIGSRGDHNVTTGSDASSADLQLGGLGLNESHEDSEKMLDNILQECAVEDPKSLHQTSSFWNGLLDDGVPPTGLESADGAKGGRVREAEMAGRLGGTAKLGYHCDLVGYGRSTAAERRPGKSKRRKVLKRCSYLVGSSYFTVKNLPKEEIFQPLLDANGEPICLDPLEPDTQAATELRDCSAAVPIDDLLPPGSVPERDVMEPVEIKMEEDVLQGASSLDSPLPPMASTSLVDRIKLEPPDEVISRSVAAVSETGGPATLAPGTIQFLPTFGGSPTVTLPSTAATIKLEAPSPVPSSSFNHINAIASPATIVVSQPSSTVFSTSGVPTMVSVSLAQGGPATLHQLVPTSTTSSLGTTMLVMQSMPPATVASIGAASNSIMQASPSVSIGSASGQTSFLITNSGTSQQAGINSSTGSAGLGASSVAQSIAGSILLQSSAGGAVVSSTPSPASTTLASSSATTTLLSSGTPIVVTVPPLPAAGGVSSQQQQHTVVTHVLPASSNSVVPTTAAAATPIVVSATGTGTTTVQSVLQAAAQSGVSGNSYILQHNSTPIVLSHQQMQQLTSGGGGNIVTVGGQQMVTAKQHHGETYVLTQSSPLKKQINGPTDGSKNATSAAVTAQNIANQKFHALLSQKLSHKSTDLNKKQLEMIRKALVASPKMIVKSANHPLAQQQQQQQQLHGPVGGLVAGHHQQAGPGQQQQQQQYNVIHQNSLNSPITIVSAQSTGQPGTQNKIILTSSPQLLQQATTVGGATAGQLLAAAASSHGKIQLTTVQQSPQNAGAGAGGGPGGPTLVTLDGPGQGTATVGTVQQQVKLDKNRILYATNIKNSRGQFLAQLNPKLVNIIQPMQQQKLINSVTLQQQQQQQQQLQLHNQNAVNSLHGATTTTTILNSKGQTVQRIPTVSIRTQQQPLQQQQQQQQQASQQATLLDTGPTHTVVVNNANNIKFIQAAAAAAAAAAGGNAGNAVVSANSNNAAGTRLVSVSSAGTPTVVSISSAGPAGGTSSGPEPGTGGSGGSNCTQPTSVGVTNSNPSTGGPPATTSVAPVAITASTTTNATTGGGATGPTGPIGCSNGGGGGAGGKSNPPASINITNR